MVSSFVSLRQSGNRGGRKGGIVAIHVALLSDRFTIVECFVRKPNLMGTRSTDKILVKILSAPECTVPCARRDPPEGQPVPGMGPASPWTHSRTARASYAQVDVPVLLQKQAGGEIHCSGMRSIINGCMQQNRMLRNADEWHRNEGPIKEKGV